MKKKILTEALRQAREKLVKHPLLGLSYTHFSFIVSDCKIIESGVNNFGVPPVHFGYDARNRQWDKNFSGRTHSELDAFTRARGLLKGDNFQLINIRLNVNGEIRNSCPCGVCSGWLSAVGCRKVAFTTDNGWAETVA